MNEQELATWVKTAFEPFVRGFCKHGTTLNVSVQADRIDADVLLAEDDFQSITGDVHVASALKQAFSALCRQNDLSRGASLAFRRAA